MQSIMVGVCFILSFPICIFYEWITGITEGFWAGVLWIVAIFTPLILYYVGGSLIYLIFVKPGEDREAEEKKRIKEVAERKAREEIESYNKNIYPKKKASYDYTMEKAEELYKLYEPIQNKEIEDIAIKKWKEISAIMDKKKLEWEPYDKEYRELDKEFGSIDVNVLYKLYEILNSHRASTIKEAYDVIEMREHNKKMESIAKQQAEAELVRAEAAEQMRRDNIRFNQQQLVQADRQYEREREREKAEHDRKVKKLMDADARCHDTLLGGSLAEYDRKKAYYDLFGK